MGNTSAKRRTSSSRATKYNQEEEAKTLGSEPLPKDQIVPLESKEFKKKNKERLVREAKDDFYQGNQMFREAKFDSAKDHYRLAMEKLQSWNQSMPNHYIKQAQQQQKQYQGKQEGVQSSDSAEGGDSILHHEAVAMTSLGVMHFAEGCYKESQELLAKALERHRAYQSQGGSSMKGDVTSIETNLSTMCLTSLSLQIKKDLVLFNKSNPSSGYYYGDSLQSDNVQSQLMKEQILISQLTEYSTLDAMLADLLNNLAACHEVLGELQEAKTFFEESLQLRTVVYGNKSLKVAETMQNLATILDSQGDYPAAENYLTNALIIETHELGENHIETAVTMNNLGVLLAHLNQFDRAKELLEKSVHMRQRFYGENHHLTICAKQNLEYVISKLEEMNQTLRQQEEQKKLTVATKHHAESKPAEGVDQDSANSLRGNDRKTHEERGGATPMDIHPSRHIHTAELLATRVNNDQEGDNVTTISALGDIK